MYSTTKHCITVILAALMLFLFTVPGAYLFRFCAALDADSERALDAIEKGQNPKPALTTLRDRFDGGADTLRLFLDHGAVDAVSAAVHALVPLEDGAEIKSALEALRAELKQLSSIERVDLYTLF